MAKERDQSIVAERHDLRLPAGYKPLTERQFRQRTFGRELFDELGDGPFDLQGRYRASTLFTAPLTVLFGPRRKWVRGLSDLGIYTIGAVLAAPMPDNNRLLQDVGDWMASVAITPHAQLLQTILHKKIRYLPASPLPISPDEELRLMSAVEEVLRRLHQLPETTSRRASYLRKHFGLDAGFPTPYKQIAQEMAVSFSGVDHIGHSALRDFFQQGRYTLAPFLTYSLESVAAYLGRGKLELHESLRQVKVNSLSLSLQDKLARISMRYKIDPVMFFALPVQAIGIDTVEEVLRAVEPRQL